MTSFMIPPTSRTKACMSLSGWTPPDKVLPPTHPCCAAHRCHNFVINDPNLSGAMHWLDFVDSCHLPVEWHMRFNQPHPPTWKHPRSKKSNIQLHLFNIIWDHQLTLTFTLSKVKDLKQSPTKMAKSTAQQDGQDWLNTHGTTSRGRESLASCVRAKKFFTTCRLQRQFPGKWTAVPWHHVIGVIRLSIADGTSSFLASISKKWAMPHLSYYHFDTASIYNTSQLV